MLLLYKSYNYINKQKLFLKLGRGSWGEGREGRGGFRDTPILHHTGKRITKPDYVRFHNLLIEYLEIEADLPSDQSQCKCDPSVTLHG